MIETTKRNVSFCPTDMIWPTSLAVINVMKTVCPSGNRHIQFRCSARPAKKVARIFCHCNILESASERPKCRIGIAYSFNCRQMNRRACRQFQSGFSWNFEWKIPFEILKRNLNIWMDNRESAWISISIAIDEKAMQSHSGYSTVFVRILQMMNFTSQFI